MATAMERLVSDNSPSEADIFSHCWHVSSVSLLFDESNRDILAEEIQYLGSFVEQVCRGELSGPSLLDQLKDGKIFLKLLQKYRPHVSVCLNGQTTKDYFDFTFAKLDAMGVDLSDLTRDINNEYQDPELLSMLWKIRRLYFCDQLKSHYEETLEETIADAAQVRQSMFGRVEDAQSNGIQTDLWNSDYCVFLRILEQNNVIFTENAEKQCLGGVEFTTLWMRSPRLLIALCAHFLIPAEQQQSADNADSNLRVHSILQEMDSRLSGGQYVEQLMQEIEEKNVEAVKQLLNMEGVSTQIHRDGWKHLKRACELERLEIVELLIPFSATHEWTNFLPDSDNQCFELLMNAIKTKNIVVLRKLLTIDKVQKQINREDQHDRYTPLMWASKLGFTDVVELLIPVVTTDHINDVAGWNGNTALHIATGRNRHETVILLLANQANVNIQNKFGMTPLMLAAELKVDDALISTFLRIPGIDVKKQDQDEYTALILAAQYSNTRAIELLCEFDRSPDHIEQRNKFGKTALFLTAENGNLNALRFMYEKTNADPNTMSKRGMSPLMLAITLGHYDCIEYLVTGFSTSSLTFPGRPVSDPNKLFSVTIDGVDYHRTALTVACGLAKCSVEVIDLLLNCFLSGQPQAQGQASQFGATATEFNPLVEGFLAACKSGNPVAAAVVKRLAPRMEDEHIRRVFCHRDSDNNSCMMHACSSGNVELLEELWDCLRTILHVRRIYHNQPSAFDDEFNKQITARNYAGKTSLILLAEYFTEQDDKMIKYIKNAAKLYDSRSYLFDMFPKLLVRCKSPNTVMNVVKDGIANNLREHRGPNADLQLLSALVNICVGLGRAAAAHSTESSDLLALQNEFECTVLELMNCRSMDDPANVTKILRKDWSNHLPEPVVRANSLHGGPLFECMNNNLSKILSSAHIKTFVDDVFYTSLKQSSDVPLRHPLDIFRLRSSCPTSRFKPFVLFTVKCLLMPAWSLTLVLCVLATSEETCKANGKRGSDFFFWSFLCYRHSYPRVRLIVHIIGRVLFEIGEIGFSQNFSSITTHWALGLYQISCDTCAHLFSNTWKVLDVATLLCLLAWLLSKCQWQAALVCSIIPLCLGMFRFLSLFQQVGQLIIMVVEMVRTLMPFVYILLGCMTGFGLTYPFLFPSEFQSWPSTALFLFKAAMGDFSFGDNATSVGVSMMIIYVLLLSLVLLNLIVARMSATHEKLNATAIEVWSMAQAVNAKEFSLLVDRSPLSMLPSPLNILVVAVWFCFDRRNNLSVSEVGTKSRISMESSSDIDSLTQHQNDPSSNGSVISYAGTFSTFVVCLVTSPFHAVFEYWLALKAIRNLGNFDFLVLGVTLFPLWITVFWIRILCHSFDDTTMVTSLDIFGNGKVEFKEKFLSHQPRAWLLMINIWMASILMSILMWALPAAEGMHICARVLSTMYHLVAFQLTLTVIYLLFIRHCNCFQISSISIHHEYFILGWRIRIVGHMLVMWFTGAMTILVESIVIILMVSYALLLNSTGTGAVEESAISKNWTKKKGDTVEKPKIKNVLIEIKVIRAALNVIGQTVFGTDRNPFIVVSYNRAQGPVDHYTSTATREGRSPNYNQTFYFEIEEGHYEFLFSVYDRVGEYVSLLGSRSVNVQEWIANRRFEDNLDFFDSVGNKGWIQLQVRVHFPESGAGAAVALVRYASTVNNNTLGKPSPGPHAPSNRYSTAHSYQKRSFFMSRTVSVVTSVGDEGRTGLFTKADRENIFDMLINKSDRNILLRIANTATTGANSTTDADD